MLFQSESCELKHVQNAIRLISIVCLLQFSATCWYKECQSAYKQTDEYLQMMRHCSTRRKLTKN